MICNHCGESIPDNIAACPFCGQSVEAEKPTQSSGGLRMSSNLKSASSMPVNSPVPPSWDENHGGVAAPPAPTPPAYMPPANPYMHSSAGYVGTAPASRPLFQRKTNKSLLKTILLSIVTLGIYPMVVMSTVSDDINVVASRYDGKSTMNYCLISFIFSSLTLGVASFVWSHRISNRIGNELRRRGIGYSFGASDYWLWDVLGSLIIVGPFIYTYKLYKAVNKMNAHYNMYG